MNKIVNAREFKTKYKTKYSAMAILKKFRVSNNIGRK